MKDILKLGCGIALGFWLILFSAGILSLLIGLSLTDFLY